MNGRDLNKDNVDPGKAWEALIALEQSIADIQALYNPAEVLSGWVLVTATQSAEEGMPIVEGIDYLVGNSTLPTQALGLLDRARHKIHSDMDE